MIQAGCCMKPVCFIHDQKKGGKAMRNVYLFELDSVKTSDREIAAAQKAMFDEIVCNGNCVVLSMNQMTDSRAVMSMLNDEEQYHILMELFQRGYIKYSLYKDCFTMSHYIQRSIKEKRGFIYSSLPVKSTQYLLQQRIYDSLRFADTNAFKALLQQQKDSEDPLPLFDENVGGQSKASSLTKKEALDILNYLQRFIELIIKTSMIPESALPALCYDEDYPPFRFSDFMKLILSFQDSYPVFAKAKSILQKIEDRLQNEHKNVESRSEWLLQLLDEKEKTTDRKGLCLAECIVNLCYNYAVEYSICDVSKHYEVASLSEPGNDSFHDDFFSRLKIEWENESNDEHRFLKEENNSFAWFQQTKGAPDWKMALRILEKRKNDEQENDLIELYENHYEQRRDEVRRQNRRVLTRLLAGAALSVLFLFAYFQIDNLISAMTDQLVTQLFANEILRFVMLFIIINLVSWILEKVSGVSTMIEVMQRLYQVISDLIRMSRLKACAYVNDAALDDLLYEKKHRRKLFPENQDESIAAYKKLWRQRPECFLGEEMLPLVDPEQDRAVWEQVQANGQCDLGIVYQSPYYIHLVDLVKGTSEQDASTRFYPYERLLPASQGGSVVIAAKYQGRFLLLKQFRHAIREYQYGFIRGFGEKGLSTYENALKEMKEEVGGVICSPMHYLGEISADSGIIACKTAVYYAELESFCQTGIHEGIKDILLVDDEQMKTMISSNLITDGFTLAAFSLLSHHNF